MRENPLGGGSFVRSLGWLGTQSPLRGFSRLAASPAAKIPRRRTPRIYKAHSEAQRQPDWHPTAPPATGTPKAALPPPTAQRTTPCYGINCQVRWKILSFYYKLLLFVFFFLFVFLSLFCWIVSSDGAPVERPGLTCYPYNQMAYTISFPSPEERAATILKNGPSKTQGCLRFRYAPKFVAAKSFVQSFISAMDGFMEPEVWAAGTVGVSTPALRLCSARCAPATNPPRKSAPGR